MAYTILVVNPGSTTTRTAVYVDSTEKYSATVSHDMQDRLGDIIDQLDWRKQGVLDALSEWNVPLEGLSCVMGRGGMLPPVNGGGYLVNQAMIDDLTNGRAKPHASNLGALIADAIAKPLGIPAYIYDAVSTDELAPVARITGIPEIVRQSFCHVLNSRAVARMQAEKIGKPYEQCNFIVAHIGGGISVSAHGRGRIVDVITDDAGPFSPERAGSVPLGYIIDICYSGQYTKQELNDKLKKNSGIKGHLGTNNGIEIERRIDNGDALAAAVYEAQAYQIAKGIGEMAPPLSGDIDAVILTGGLARSEYIVGEVARRVAYLGPIAVYPGEYEMQALALGALRLLSGVEEPGVYGGDGRSTAALAP